MNYLPDGSITFNSIPEMYYDLFMEIGLAVRAQDQYLYDQDTLNPIKFKDKFIKASVDGTPLYAGRNDIVFEPDKNYSLIARLFELYLDKCTHSDDGDLLQGYIAHYIEDDGAKEKQRVCVKTYGRGVIESAFYFNIYLAYIDCLFRVAGYVPHLEMFDVRPV